MIQTVEKSIQLTKKLLEINKKIQNADLSNYLSDLKLELAEVKSGMSELMIENAELKRKIDQLNHAQGDKSSDLIFNTKENAYYSSTGEGPFCSGCYDTQNNKVRLTRISGTFSRLAKYKCPTCKATY